MRTDTRYIVYAVLAALLLTSVSCTERELEMRPVPVRLYTEILTRAAVDRFEETPVSVAKAGEDGVYAEIWDGVASDNEIVLVPGRYYPDDGSVISLRGYYPQAPIDEGGTVTYSLTGREDLMASSVCGGSKDAPITPESGGTMVFGHLMAKLIFVVEVSGTPPPGVYLQEVTLDGLAAQAQVSLLDASLTVEGNAPAVEIYSAGGGQGLPLDGQGEAYVPEPLFVQPGGDFRVNVTLTADEGAAQDYLFEDCAVEFEEGEAEGGKAYRVRIVLPSIGQPGLRVTAEAVPWETDEVGGDLILKPETTD